MQAASAAVLTGPVPWDELWVSPLILPSKTLSGRLFRNEHFEEEWRGEVRKNLEDWDRAAINPTCPPTAIDQAVKDASVDGVLVAGSGDYIRVTVPLCGENRTINFMVFLLGKAPAVRSLTPGHPLGDFQLTGDALKQTVPVITPFANKALTACKAAHPTAQARLWDIQQIDHAENPDLSQRSWRELWIYRACGRDLPITVTFVQTAGKPGFDILGHIETSKMPSLK